MPSESLAAAVPGSICSVSADETVPIRHSVLWPDVPADSDILRLPEDDHGFHFGVFLPGQDGAPIAIISLFREDTPPEFAIDSLPEAKPGSVWRFRKFACLPEHQGKGYGSALLKSTIGYARDQFNASHVWCDARLSAAGWYERRGFQAFGGVFLKHGVEYVRMIILA